MKPTGRTLTIFAKYGGWGCLANFTREEGPFWLTSPGTCPCRGPDAHTRASGSVKIVTASPDGPRRTFSRRGLGNCRYIRHKPSALQRASCGCTMFLRGCVSYFMLRLRV